MSEARESLPMGKLPQRALEKETAFDGASVLPVSLLDREEADSHRRSGTVIAKRGKSKEQIYRRWQNAPPEERELLEQRMEQWNRMSPKERERYRHRYQQYRRLSPEEQRRLQRDLDRWDQLSPKEKEGIRRKFTD